MASFADLLKDRKSRNRIILAILIVVLAFIVFFQFLIPKREAYPVDERALMCSSCKARGVKVVGDIEDDNDRRNYCKRCGGRLRLAAKCLKCKYEFPMPSKKNASFQKLNRTMDKFRFINDMEKCPNCMAEPPETILIEGDRIKDKADL